MCSRNAFLISPKRIKYLDRIFSLVRVQIRDSVLLGVIILCNKIFFESTFSNKKISISLCLIVIWQMFDSNNIHASSSADFFVLQNIVTSQNKSKICQKCSKRELTIELNGVSAMSRKHGLI